MVLGSRRRSFLQPTRMIGRPAQKCMTSEIHYTNSQLRMNTFAKVHATCWEARITYLLLNVIQTIGAVNCETDEDNVRVGIAQGPQSMNSMKVTSEAISKSKSAARFTGHSLLDQPYPKGQARRAFRLLRRLLHSSRKRWEHRPGNEKGRSQQTTVFYQMKMSNK